MTTLETHIKQVQFELTSQKTINEQNKEKMEEMQKQIEMLV